MSPQRLVFAPRRPVAEHLARHCLADLFLDTLPYNAHVTTADALWAGLPVLTYPGNTFASRVAGSLLHAIGLDELVTTSLDEYEALALRLAREPTCSPSCEPVLHKTGRPTHCSTPPGSPVISNPHISRCGKLERWADTDCLFSRTLYRQLTIAISAPQSQRMLQANKEAGEPPFAFPLPLPC